jgi:hypothetical protein
LKLLSPSSARLCLIVLFVLIVARFVVHTLYVPVFEGPDEPGHLARVMAFVEGSLAHGLAGAEVGERIVAAVRSRPCCVDLSRGYGCPPFGSEPAAFNVLQAPPQVRATAVPRANYEAHQPPLFYLVSGGVLRTLDSALPRLPKEPEHRLLALRLISVALAVAGVLALARLLARVHGEGWTALCLLPLLLPGASEALARGANEAGVFLWCAMVVLAAEREARTPVLLVLLALGPLIKLTALPVVAFGIVYLWRERGRRAALCGCLCSCLFLPLQWLRGWAWGGTVELNTPGSLIEGETLTSLTIGLARSCYTFLKTAVWLGEWSFFHAPTALVVTGGLLALTWLATSRLRAPSGWRVAHVVAALSCVLGVLLFVVVNRKHFGVWGGVGGWYLWAWYPWLGVAVGDCFESRKGSRRLRAVLVLATVTWIAAANVLWFTAANGLYGLP